LEEDEDEDGKEEEGKEDDGPDMEEGRDVGGREA
jgi:hypothetical protein